MTTTWRSILLVIVLCARAFAAPLDEHDGHQAPPRPLPKAETQPHPETILGWEPIRCWRQSTAGAITIGETFTVVVTCAVYEGDNAQVASKKAILGALTLYLDFINLFMLLLQFFGQRRD